MLENPLPAAAATEPEPLHKLADREAIDLLRRARDAVLAHAACGRPAGARAEAEIATGAVRAALRLVPQLDPDAATTLLESVLDRLHNRLARHELVPLFGRIDRGGRPTVLIAAVPAGRTRLQLDIATDRS